MTLSRWTCNWPARGTSPLDRRWTLLAGTLLSCLPLLAGCSSDKADKSFKAFVFRPTPGRAVLFALQEENPDTRRRYLRTIIKRKELTHDWCVKSLDVIARTDADSQVRCLAIRALAKGGRPEGAETALSILNPKLTTKPVRLGEDEVRFDCLSLLEQYLQAGKVPAGQMDAVREAVTRAAADETNPQARMVAVRSLRHFPGKESLAILVNTLRENNFGLMFEAEMSLRSLTGRVGDYEADHWQAWLSQSEDPFAGRSAYIQMIRTRDTFWRRAGEATGELWNAWQGPSKPTARPSPAAAVKQAEGQRMIMEAAQ